MNGLDRTVIYTIYHKDMVLPRTDILYPIRSDRRDGTHIADREGYCELRAQYWIWKNGTPTDYVGFFHYRRYLELLPERIVTTPIHKHLRPYRFQKSPNAAIYTMRNVQFLKEMDVIAPLWEYTGIPVRKRYAASAGHRQEDLALMETILAECSSEYLPAAERYLSGEGEYFGNIYIMRWTLFEEYCAWLFYLLNEFDCRATNVPDRTQGYLGERLFGIWFTALKERAEIHWGELPRVHFSCYGNRCESIKQRMIDFFLPPGTTQRAMIRKLL